MPKHTAKAKAGTPLFDNVTILDCPSGEAAEVPELADGESVPAGKSKGKVVTKSALARAIRAGKVGNDALIDMRFCPDKKIAFSEFGKNLEEDEFKIMVQALSKFEVALPWLRALCRAESKKQK